jgi:hypothetical protein
MKGMLEELVEPHKLLFDETDDLSASMSVALIYTRGQSTAVQREVVCDLRP